jgi:hypothetical protein
MDRPAAPAYLQQADVLVQDVLGAAVAHHALECDVGAHDLHELVGEVILAPVTPHKAASNKSSATCLWWLERRG